MKRLVLLVLIVFFGMLGVIEAQDTVYVRKGNVVLKKVVPKEEKVISRIQFQKGVDLTIFSDQEVEWLDNGKLVEKRFNSGEIPIKLLPVVKIANHETISSYKQRNGTVRKLAELKKGKAGNPRKDWIISILWMFIPFLMIFLLSILSTKNDEGRKYFIIFSLSTIVVIVFAIAIGWFLGMDPGIFAGGIAGALAGGLAGGLVRESVGMLAGVFAGMLAGVFAGVLAGGFAGGFAGLLAKANASPEILWQYLLLYVVICVLALVLREAISFKRKRVNT